MKSGFIPTSYSSHHASGFIIGSIKNFLIGVFSTSAILFLLFQKKLLPKFMGKFVSKALFYPTFPLTIAMRIGNFWTEIDDTVILGCAPMGFLDHPKNLFKLGVRGVVNMCYEYPGPLDYYAELGIKQLRLPVIDHEEPSVDDMKEAVKFIQSFQEKNQRVYIHCKAGHGRAAVITLCWLIQQNPKTSPKELNLFLSKRRRVRPTLFKQPNLQKFAALAAEKSPTSQTSCYDNLSSNGAFESKEN